MYHASLTYHFTSLLNNMQTDQATCLYVELSLAVAPTCSCMHHCPPNDIIVKSQTFRYTDWAIHPGQRKCCLGVSKSPSYFINTWQYFSNTTIYGETLCNSVKSGGDLLHWGKGIQYGGICRPSTCTCTITGLDWWTGLVEISIFASTWLGYATLTTVSALSIEPSRGYL